MKTFTEIVSTYLFFLFVGFPLALGYFILTKLHFVKSSPDTTFAAFRKFIDDKDDCNTCGQLTYKSLASGGKFESLESKLGRYFTRFAVAQNEFQVTHTILSVCLGVHNYMGADIYKCNECGNLWELSIPDQSWGGYFRRIEISNDIPPEKIKYVEIASGEKQNAT